LSGISWFWLVSFLYSVFFEKLNLMLVAFVICEKLASSRVSLGKTLEKLRIRALRKFVLDVS
jgi:hypothetical protein